MSLATLAAAHSVATSYLDQQDNTVQVSERAVVAALAALGVDASGPAAIEAALAEQQAAPWRRLLPCGLVVREGEPAIVDVRAPAGAELAVHTEDGRTVPVPVRGKVVAERGGLRCTQVPLPELPLGWHRLQARAGGRTCEAVLVVAPARLPQLPVRAWGWMVQLYALRSAHSWGVGDYADLRTIAAHTCADGAGVLLVNPLHAETPSLPVEPSPYSPSSRRFRSPLWLRVEQTPEYLSAPAHLQDGVDALKPQPDAERIERDPAWAAKLAALELLWPLHRVDALAAFRDEIGQPLEGFALFCALAEVHGANWQDWPAELRRPDGPAVVAARAKHADRISFWCWTQLLVDEQVAAVAGAAETMTVGVVHDLAVGVHPGGADAWALQDALAMHTTVGAPPDAFSQQGQDWGLPPWRPDRLREQGWQPYRELVQAILRHAGGLRIDHIMGLFRLWWVPPGDSPAEGTYVGYDAEAMLGILALEAQRAGAVVIGEDLGTVEQRVGAALQASGVLGSSVLWFERDETGFADPRDWRANSAATITTHDLPTAAGFLAQEHVRVRAELGTLAIPVEEERAQAQRQVEDLYAMLTRTGLLARAGGDPVVAMHLALVRAPSVLVLVAFGDAVGDLRQPNLPGTVDAYPNWRLPVADAAGRPLLLGQLLAHPGVTRLAALLRNGVR